MSLITIYKGDRSIFVDNSPNGLEIMKKAGWTEKAPQGWEDRDVVAEDTIDSLRKQVADLTTKLEERSTQIDPSAPQPIVPEKPAKRGRKKQGESD